MSQRARKSPASGSGHAEKPEGRWLAASRWLLVAAAALVPLAAGYVPFAGAGGVFMSHSTTPAQTLAFGVLIGAALVCCAIAFVRGELALKRVPYVWLLVGYLAVVSVSTMTALDSTIALFGKEETQQGLLAMAGYAGAFILVTQVGERTHLMRMVQAMAVSGAIVSLFGVLQSLGLPYFPLPQESYLNERGTSTLGNPDTLGTFLIVPLLCSLGLSLATSGGRRWLWRAAAALTAISLLLTQTRGAWLGALVALVVFAVVVARMPRTGDRGWVKWAEIALLVVAGLGVALYKAVSGAQPLLWRLMQSGTGADGGRLFVWSEVLRVIREFPVLGAGPDNILYGWYLVSTSAQVPILGIDGVINEAHNYWLGTAVSSGIVAAVLLLAFVAAVLVGSRTAVTQRLSAGQESADRMVFSSLWAGTLGLVVALVFAPVITPIGLALWTSLGLLALPKVTEVGAPAVRGAREYALAGLAVLVGLALLGWGGATGAGSSVEYVRGGDGVAAARRAQRITPWRHYPIMLEAQLLKQQGASPAQIVPVVDRLIALSPRGYEYYVIKARLQNAEPPAVLVTADAGLAAYPAGLRLQSDRAVARAALGDMPAALSEASAAWAIARTAPDSYRDASVGIAYAQILAVAGERDSAMRIVDELATAFPGDTDVEAVRGFITSGGQ